MNILLLGHYQEKEILTGPQKFAKRMADELSVGHHVTFICYFQDGKLYSKWTKLFGSRIIIQKNNLQVLQLGVMSLIVHLFINRYNIVHIVTFERFIFIAFLLKSIINAKIVYTCHGIQAVELRDYHSYLPNIYILKNIFIEKLFFRLSDVVVFVSKLHQSIAIKEMLTFRDQKVIINGVDEIFYNNAIDNKEKHPFSLIFVGDVKRKEKGFSFILDAVKNISHNIILTVISNDPVENTFPTNIQLKTFKRMDTVRYAEILKQQDLIIASSVYDSFSIVVAEAMAGGVVPIVTETTGIKELIINDSNGFIVNYGDSNSLSELVHRLYSDKHLLAELSKSAHLTMLNHRWSNVAQEYIKLYNDICK